MKLLFWLCALGGAGAAIYIYGIKFDSFSETKLIEVSALWFLPFIFGVYGLVASRFIKNEETGTVDMTDANKIAAASSLTKPTQIPPQTKRHILGTLLGTTLARIPVIGMLLSLFIIALLLPIVPAQKYQSAIVMAVVGTVIWAGILFIFIVGIFPML